MKHRVYVLPGGWCVRDLAHAVCQTLLYEEKMDALLLSDGNGAYVVCARARNGPLTRWIGLDRRVAVRLTQTEDGAVRAEIGRGEWLHKHLSLAVSLVVLWPLSVTSLIGLARQALLPARVDKTIRRFCLTPEGVWEGESFPLPRCPL